MRRKLSAAVILGLLIVGLALPAQAHSFTGGGDCDGWTLHLDGTWNAYDITVDGSSIGLEQNPQIADGSDATSRTFVVRWWKQGPDVERTVTVERILDCDTTTTTTTNQETTSTTQPSTTTTSSAPDATTTTGSSTDTTTSTTLPAPTTTLFPTFTPRIECRNENVVIDAVWNPSEFLSVDVYLGEPDSTIEAHLILGEEWITSAAPGQKFTLVGNADGFVQSQIVFAPAGCADDPPPIPSDAPELPFTGIGGTVGLLLAGAALLGLGVSTVRASKRIPE